MNKKILIGSIIAVTLLVLMSTTLAVNVKKDNENNIESIDFPIEVISLIRGNCQGIGGGNPGGPLLIGQVSFTVHPAIGMNIRALTVNPLKSYSATASEYIDTSFFFGFQFWTAGDNIAIIGFAFGDIEWS